MLLSNAVKRIKDRSHRGDVNITTDDITAQILRACSDSKRELMRRIPRRKLWKQATLSIVQGTTTYSLASDTQELVVIRYTVDNSLKLPLKADSDREWYQTIFDPNAAQADPTHYREVGPDGSDNKQVEFYPTPKQAITFTYEYYKTPNTEFTTSDLTNEIADIPEQLHDALWKGALYGFLKGFDDPGQAVAKSDYNEALLAYDIQEDEDQDSDLAFRFGLSGSLVNKPNFFNSRGNLF